MVRLEKISKSFGDKTVIRDLSLNVAEGEIFTLLGESGCGKTTLLRLIAGFERPDTGSIFIGGENMLPLPAEKRPVGFIFQNYALFPHMTVYENIAVGPRVRRVAESEIEKQITGLLEIIRMQEHRDAYPGQLSGGESQRVAVARAIINRPKILLLDEPLSALDESLRQNLREELVEMQKTFGITFLFVTHDQDEAMSLSHQMGIIENGQLLQVGKPEELYHRPKNAYVAGFLGDINRINAVVEQQTGTQVTLQAPKVGRVLCESKTQLPAGAEIAVYIRPEKIRLTTQPEQGKVANQLQGTIVNTMFRGSHTRYQMKLDNGDLLHILIQHSPEAHVKTTLVKDDRVFALFDSEDVMLFDSKIDTL